jgi:hypothetical protein
MGQRKVEMEDFAERVFNKNFSPENSAQSCLNGTTTNICLGSDDFWKLQSLLLKINFLASAASILKLNHFLVELMM